MSRSDAAKMVGSRAIPAGIIAVIGMAVAASCFNPHVVSGQLSCSSTGKCPEGFKCGVADNLCWKDGELPGGTGGGGSGGSGGRGGSGGSAVLGELGQSCLIRDEGEPTQSDTCDTDASLVCVNDCSAARCFQLCGGDADCPQSACNRSAPTPEGDRQVCELPYVDCDPMAVASEGSRCPGGLVCVLLAADPSPSNGNRTVCDCGHGTAGRGEPCTGPRSCFPGMVCPPLGAGPGAEFCRVVCDPAAGCPLGGTCRPFGAKWGYCF